MIVVDTNIIGYLYLSSEYSAKAEAVLNRDPEWCAPLLWRSELRNVLAFYIRKKMITLPDAQQIMSEAAQLMQGREYNIVSHQVLNLVAESTCSAYDCEYVALAKDLGLRFVTNDKQILAQFPDIAQSPEQFTGQL
jgi:predicted nucleic acid-binding protein